MVTVPGEAGVVAAFAAEYAITLLLLTTVLAVNNTPRLARYTGACVGLLVALYITLEDPLSGMSMNPARTLASAILGHNYTALWVYFTAPPLGMLTAAELYLWWRGRAGVRCAKLHHDDRVRCIFCRAVPEQRPAGGSALATGTRGHGHPTEDRAQTHGL